MSAPLIEFDQFAHPQMWLFKRGLPPWLGDQRWYANAFRATLFFWFVGSFSGVMSVAAIWGIGLLSMRASSFSGAFFFVPGIFFGAIILMPISRWSGRGWLMTVVAVPVACLAHFGAVMMFFQVAPIFGPGNLPEWAPGGRDTAGFYAGLVGAAIVSVWMGNPKRSSAWLAGFSACTLGSFGCGFLLWSQSAGPTLWTSLGLDALNQMLPFQVFQSFVAVGLGMRLWWSNNIEERSINQ